MMRLVAEWWRWRCVFLIILALAGVAARDAMTQAGVTTILRPHPPPLCRRNCSSRFFGRGGGGGSAFVVPATRTLSSSSSPRPTAPSQRRRITIGVLAASTSAASSSTTATPSSLDTADDLDDDGNNRAAPNRYDALWSWAASSQAGKTRLHPSIRPVIRPPNEGGAGLIATSTIESNVVVVSIPLQYGAKIDVAGILPELLLLASASSSSESDNKEEDKKTKCWAVPQRIEEVLKDEGSSNAGAAALTGVIAELHLLRLSDARRKRSEAASSSPLQRDDAYSSDDDEMDDVAVRPEVRLGPFLDVLPLLPQLPSPPTDDHGGEGARVSPPPPPPSHPFPTHILHWTCDEIETLLAGTIAQTKARSIRAGAGAIVHLLSGSFVREHCRSAAQAGAQEQATPLITHQDVLDALVSSFAAVLSRGFGDESGKDASGKGRALLPILDLLNHDGVHPNVRWGWEEASDGSISATVETLQTVQAGEELLKDYGARPSWDWVVSYGFVPRPRREEEVPLPPGSAAGVPLFPAAAVTRRKRGGGGVEEDAESGVNNDDVLDLTLESNYGPLVRTVIERAAATTSTEESNESTTTAATPIEIVSLFRPAPTTTGGRGTQQESKPTTMMATMPRRQPCVVVHAPSLGEEQEGKCVRSLLPIYCAAASVLSEKIATAAHGDDDSVPHTTCDDSGSVVEKNGSSPKEGVEAAALNLLRDGIQDRIRTLEVGGAAAVDWLAGSSSSSTQHPYRRSRAKVAEDVRKAELDVLRALEAEVDRFNC